MITISDICELLNEKQYDNLTVLPDAIIKDVKTNIRKGASDLEQKWANALELVHTAYKTANVKRPVPAEKGAWMQYEQMIRYAVKQLVTTRGINGDWRSTRCLFKEAEDFTNVDQDDQQMQSIGSKRFFATIPGVQEIEITDVKSLDQAVIEMTNLFKRGGYRLQVDTKDADVVTLSIWYQDAKREELIIRQI